MVSITIRNVSAEVRDELAARAARSGRSLQEYLAAELAELASHPDPDDALSQIRMYSRSVHARLRRDDLLADIDADRR
jgi:plasmid stability protein